MKGKKIIILAVALIVIAGVAAGLFIFFSHRGDAEEGPTEPTAEAIKAPEEYVIENMSVPGFPVGKTIQVLLTVPLETEAPETEAPETEATEETEETEETEGTSEGTEETEASEPAASETSDTAASEATAPASGVHVKGIYQYRGVTDMPERIEDYCSMLLRQDFGFVPVDQGNMEIEMPFVRLPNGDVRLVRQVTGDEKEGSWMFSLGFQWQGDQLDVILAQVDGEVVQPPAPSEPEGSRPSRKEPITIYEALEIFSRCTPSQLGLGGGSMKDYEVIILDGSVMVGEEPCMRVNLYEKSETAGTNVIAGMYLLECTGERMYRADLSDAIYPVPMPAK